MKKNSFVSSAVGFFSQKTSIICAIIVSLLYSLMLVLGYSVNNGIDIAKASIPLLIIAAWILMFAVVSGLWIMISASQHSDRTIIDSSIRKNVGKLFLFQACLLVFWLFPWLASWPGFFCYDAECQYAYWTGLLPMSDHQPLLHTAILGFLIDTGKELFGSVNSGIAFYIGVQALVLSAVFAFVILKIYASGARTVAAVISFAWYAVFPTCTMFSLCSTKDSLFSAISVLYLLEIRSFVQDSQAYSAKKVNSAKLIVISVLMLLLRKNALYAFIVFAIIIVIFCRNVRRRLTFIHLTSLAFFFIASLALTVSMNSYHSAQSNDMLCVPAQQIARVYNIYGEDFFSEDEKKILYSLADKNVWSDYAAINADPIKLSLNSNYFSKNKSAVLNLWLNTFKRAPMQCITSTLINTYQSWYPGAPVTGYQRLSASTYGLGDSSYFECRVERPGTLSSKLPGLFKFYWSISRENLWQKIPGLNLLFTVGFQLWLLVFAIGYCIVTKNLTNLIPMVFPFLLFCTVLLGPVALVRYNLILFWGAPVWFLIMHDSPAHDAQSA